MQMQQAHTVLNCPHYRLECACAMQIKSDDNPRALDVLTGFLHFLERFHSTVFITV